MQINKPFICIYASTVFQNLTLIYKKSSHFHSLKSYFSNNSNHEKVFYLVPFPATQIEIYSKLSLSS